MKGSLAANRTFLADENREKQRVRRRMPGLIKCLNIFLLTTEGVGRYPLIHLVKGIATVVAFYWAAARITPLAVFTIAPFGQRRDGLSTS